MEAWARATVGAPLPETWPQVAYEPHDRLGFRMIPGDRHYTYDRPVRINAFGMRGPEPGPEDPAVTRVWILGDSMTFGHGLDEDETIGAHLVRELEARFPGRRFEAINGGVQGYSTNQELAQLDEHADELRPDVVVLQWLWNDIWQTDVEAASHSLRLHREEVPDPRAPRPWHRWLLWHGRELLRKSAFLMLANDHLKTGRPPRTGVVDRAFERLEEQLPAFAEKAFAISGASASSPSRFQLPELIFAQSKVRVCIAASRSATRSQIASSSAVFLLKSTMSALVSRFQENNKPRTEKSGA